HGQHGHQSLLSTEVQRQLLDDIADDNTLIIQLRQAYQQWKAVQTLLTQLGGRDYEAKLALLRYQVQELSAFELTPQALEDLETEHQRLAHASELLTHSQQALSGLAAEEGPSSIAYLTQVQHALHHVQQHDPRLDSVVHLLEHALIHIQEATRELQHYVAHLELDPERLQGVEQQIAALQDLTRKHKIRFAELPQYFQDLTQQLQQLEADQARLAHLDTEMAAALHHYRQAAATVHQQRLQTAQQLSEKITMHMQQLGMTGGQFTIRVTADEHATPTLQGNDKVEFLVTTNPGIAPRALSKVASGGELSRISLAIQVMIAQKSGVPSLVFDEVDVGIGGGIAEIVGKLLNQLGQQRQILCITHLPQVACQGHHHWQVSKTIQAQHTHTCIKQLTLEERIEEIARMLGGLEITAHTLVHAQEMLQRAHQLTSTMNS
ncbi:MAG: DNA repair protein RecN, partial [Pseudomonadota bacterium]|nr:DNA repair protein RecN [Pseudomonadota bacterium]